MPSRLHRLLEWPLWSWRHLSISVAALLVALALVGKATSYLEPPSVRPVAAPGVMTPSNSSTPKQPSDVATSAPTANRGSTTTASRGVPSGAPVVRPSTGGSCEAVASAFMSNWVKTSLSPATWLDGLRPYAVPKLIDQLSRTDPSSVPASRVSPKPVQLLFRPGAEGFRFATDGGRVDVTTQKSSGSCLVSDLEPANDVPGAPTPTLTPSPAGS